MVASLLSFPALRHRSLSIFHYLCAAFLSLLCVVVVLGLFDSRWLYIPFYYDRDLLYYAMTIKSVITEGWYLTDPSIGVPDGHFLGDFPTPEGLNYLIIKLISLFSSHWPLVLNVFFLLVFPLITLSSLFVLTRLGLCYPLALTASLLYAFLPYHLMRGQEHLFLTAYYLVPLGIWLAIQIYRNALFEEAHVPKSTQKRQFFLYALICILMGSTGLYYAYFTVLFLLLGGLIARSLHGHWRPFKYALIFTAIIVSSILVNIAPTLAYQYKHGINHTTIRRSPVESELYGLKMAQLLLPINNDRLFSKMKADWNEHTILTRNGNDTVTLGVIGSLGFLGLIARVFLRRKAASDSLLGALADFNLFAVLLASIGGFSFLIALFFPGIRCYYRISVFIAFFVLTAFFLFVQKKVTSSRWLWGCSFLLLAVGLFTQSPPAHMFSHSRKIAKTKYLQDHAFIQSIERSVVPGSQIFQLPYLYFPEAAPPHQMSSYGHFKGPLHSHGLKWSFGAMRERPTDLWQRQTSQLALPEMLNALIQKGFSGLYIDRTGYADHGQAIEESLSQILKITPLTDANHSFWDLHHGTVCAENIVYSLRGSAAGD